MIRLIRAYRRGIRLGEQRARQADIEFLRAHADAHHGQVGDSRRRGALNYAADAIRDRRTPGRPA